MESNLDKEVEPYILTPEDETELVEFHITKAKKNLAWRMADMGYSQDAILLRIAEVGDWKKSIEWEPIFKQANSNKTHAEWIIARQKLDAEERAREKQVLMEKQAELKARHTAKFFYNSLFWTAKNVYGTELIFNEYTAPLIKTVCYFLSKDERFETELGYTFDKGLWFEGPVGIGKTFLMKCLCDNELSPITMHSLISITERVKNKGEYFFKEVKNGITYLDDVGSEQATVKHYGTNISFFKDFIEVFYAENQALGNFNKLVISTNLNFDGIEEKYGARARSRVRQMFNVVCGSGPDMRQ